MVATLRRKWVILHPSLPSFPPKGIVGVVDKPINSRNDHCIDTYLGPPSTQKWVPLNNENITPFSGYLEGLEKILSIIYSRKPAGK
jgi:hypothetical protein